jgi:hypothetical protein
MWPEATVRGSGLKSSVGGMPLGRHRDVGDFREFLILQTAFHLEHHVSAIVIEKICEAHADPFFEGTHGQRSERLLRCAGIRVTLPRWFTTTADSIPEHAIAANLLAQGLSALEKASPTYCRRKTVRTRLVKPRPQYKFDNPHLPTCY